MARKSIEKECGWVRKGEKGYMSGWGRMLRLGEGREGNKRVEKGQKSSQPTDQTFSYIVYPFLPVTTLQYPAHHFLPFTTLFYLSPPFPTHPYPPHSFTTLSYISPSFPTLYHPFSTLHHSFLPFITLFYPSLLFSTIHHPFLSFTTLIYPSPSFLPFS